MRCLAKTREEERIGITCCPEGGLVGPHVSAGVNGIKVLSLHLSFVVEVVVSDGHCNIVTVWDDSAGIDLFMNLEERSPCDCLFFFLDSL